MPIARTRRILMWLTGTLLAPLSNCALAAHIDFENTALAAEFEFVQPNFVYQEHGFVFTPHTFNTTYIISGAPFGIGGQMVGNGTSDYLMSYLSSVVTMTHNDGAFNLLSLLMGPVSPTAVIPLGPTVSGSITGYFAGGGSAVINYSDLTTATLLIPGWSNLSSVVFSSGNYFATDNIIADVPAPGTPGLIVLGLLGLRRTQRGQAPLRSML